MDAAIQPLAISVALGLLVGLERESESNRLAGIRTFPLITMMGALGGLMSAPESWGVLAAGWLCLTLLMVSVNLPLLRGGERAAGLTTEVAVLIMFTVGFVVARGYVMPALVAAGTVVVLLHHKERMHNFVTRLREPDLGAVVKLALIALVVLPVLPDKTYGPYHVINPREIWLMVVLIAGISVFAYLVHHLLGARVGSILGGVLGGLISSTAATVSYSRQAKVDERAIPLAALGILIASTIVNARVVIEVAVASPTLLPTVIGPLAVLTAVMLIGCVLLWWRGVRASDVDGTPKPENPAQLGAAVTFGLLYAGVLLLVAFVRERAGSGALYGVAVVSGLTDVDAITLSTARIFEAQQIQASQAWRVVVIAVMSNLVFKAGAVWVLGGWALMQRVGAYFLLAIATGGALLVLWPA